MNKMPKEIEELLLKFKKELEKSGAQVKVITNENLEAEGSDKLKEVLNTLGIDPQEDMAERHRNAEAIAKYGQCQPALDNSCSRAFTITDPKMKADMLMLRNLANKEYPMIEHGPIGPADKIRVTVDLAGNDLEKMRAAGAVLYTENEGLSRMLAEILPELHENKHEIPKGKKEVWN